MDYEETLQSFIEKDNDNINIDDDDYIMNKHTPSEKLINVLKVYVIIQRIMYI